MEEINEKKEKVEEITDEDIKRLNEIEWRTEKMFSKGDEIKVLGKTFHIKPLSRKAQDMIVDWCGNIKVVDDKLEIEESTKNNDAKACACILLHNPLKIWLFRRIFTKYLMNRYNGETFYAVIKTAFDNPEQVFFYKNCLLLITAQRARMIKTS